MSTYQVLIIIYAAVCMPFSVYLLTNFFKTVFQKFFIRGLTAGAVKG
jgi:ABC-type glycerol-3-phosphate transport system permease component